MAAVLIHQRHADGNVDETEIRVRRVGRPRIILADAFRPDLGAVLPGLGAELAGLRDQVELPELLARADVEAADIPRKVPHADGVVAVNRRIADDDDVVDDDRRRARRDLTILRIDTDGAVRADAFLLVPCFSRLRLPVWPGVADLERLVVIDGQRHERKSETIHQIDDAGFAELWIRLPGLGVEQHHVIPRGHQDDAFLGALAPIGDAAPGELPRCFLPPDAFVELVLPQCLAIGRIDGERRTSRARDCENPAVGVEWRRPVVLIDPGARGLGVPLPCDLQRPEVGRVDLIEAGVAGTPGVGAPVPPFTVDVAPSGGRRGRLLGADEQDSRKDGAQHEREADRSTAIQTSRHHPVSYLFETSITSFFSSSASLESAVVPAGFPFDLRIYATT